MSVEILILAVFYNAGQRVREPRSGQTRKSNHEKRVRTMKNVLQPTGDQVRAFRDRKTGEPIAMLNLLKFRDRAVYEDGRPSDLSGEQAYAIYGRAFKEIMGPKGVTVLYSGRVKGLLIGEGDDLWDAIALIQYPSTDVMLAMLRNEEYQRAQQHRAAGLEGQLLIECSAGFSF